MKCESSRVAPAEEGEWSRFLGEWLTELAFSDLTLEEAISLQSDLHPSAP
jgi:hypothetical protein